MTKNDVKYDQDTVEWRLYANDTPEIKTSAKGAMWVKFRAGKSSKDDRNPDYIKNYSVYANVMAFNDMAERVRDLEIEKGDLLFIKAYFRNSWWMNNEGVRKETIELIPFEIHVQQRRNPDRRDEEEQARQPDKPATNLHDDDIPF